MVPATRTPDDAWVASVVESMGDAVAVIGVDGVLHNANPAAEQLVGLARAERRGRDVFDLVHPDDIGRVIQGLALLADPEPGPPLVLRIRAAAGGWAHVEVVATPMTDGPDVLVLVLRDVTARTDDGGRGEGALFASGSLDVRSELERGLRVEDVEVHYQAVVATATARAVGLEALARWRHPALGLLRPGEFLEVAQELDMVADLDRCVLDRVALDRARWRVDAPALLRLPLSVNISVAEIGSDLDRRLEAFFAAPGGAGTQLCLEVREPALLCNIDRVSDTLARLKHHDVGLTVDAIDVGYSTLPHLGHLPIRLLKLDRSFLNSVAEEDDEAVAAFVEIFEALDVHVVAVGVETFAHHQVVRSVGIEWAQGYFYAEPRSSAELESLATVGNPEPAR